MGFAKGVSLVKNEQGVAEIELSNQIRQFYLSSKNFSKKTSQIHDGLTEAITKAIASIRIAISDSYAVVDLFA